MNMKPAFGQEEMAQLGEEMHRLIVELFPICRSITGNGLRETLRILQKHIPLEIKEVPSDTVVFDWTVPKEWNIRDAYIKNARGEKVVDFRESNLHVMSYSTPIHKMMTLVELKDHLYSLPDYPDWIPYRTSYYSENWGFCVSHRVLQSLEDGEYEVVIDSSLEEGHLTYGEYLLRGQTEEEVLISCHCCHPSLCNDNLSGVALVTFLAKQLSLLSLKYSYRFLFIPVTIGAITWLSLNEQTTSRIRHGLVVAGVGDPGQSTYKRSRHGDAEIDRVVEHVLKHSGQEYKLLDFSPYGYDERQFCSPGFNLPVGSLTRTPYAQYPEYHTSADNLDFIKSDYLADSFMKYHAAIGILEGNKKFLNLFPKCEPRLGKRGLYGAIGGIKEIELAMLWVLNFSDGDHSLLDIADRANLPFALIAKACDLLLKNELLAEFKE